MEQSKRAGRTDGRLFRAEAEDLVPGTVLRMVDANGESAPFSDFVILGVKNVDELDGRPLGNPFLEVTMARPYLFATSVGTTSPSALTGVETLRADAKSVLKEGSLFRVVVTSRGAPHDFSR